MQLLTVGGEELGEGGAPVGPGADGAGDGVAGDRVALADPDVIAEGFAVGLAAGDEHPQPRVGHGQVDEVEGDEFAGA